MDFKQAIKEKILVLDGALGTMIQKFGFKEIDFRGKEFLNHPVPLSGFNDILNLTKPSYIKNIHSSYLEAGANIITTNTFNSNVISMKDYGLDKIKGLSKKLNLEGVLLAKQAIQNYKKKKGEGYYFVGGSIGPTNRSASMSPDISDPLIRNISFDDLFYSYKEQIEGLIEGGVDILIFETFFDTLNLKAGLEAANTILKNKNKHVPIMVSATVSDNAGRILSGQTLEAFVTSICHYENVSVIGLNCGFGPECMTHYVEQIYKINPHFTSCHPNAGLPDDFGCYDVSPKEFVDSIRNLLENGYLHIIGGCCGTTPEYIKELSSLVKQYTPSNPIKEKEVLSLSGLDNLTISDDFLIIGERCNVAGSAKFLRLIKEGAYEEAADIAVKEIEKGAQVIDINMDDAMINAEEEMVKFVRYILAEPEIAKVPFMIDSSNWNVIEKALKNIQGKGIVNSLSLKEGEEKFIEKAKKVRDLGFALVVMAFDEKGQADTLERKIEICKRSYDILINQCGFNPNDIIFDVNVMTIATGMKEHARYAIDFIDAVAWIKKKLPGTKTSGGISNLSFAFRGKNKLREYMHVIFLHHAKNAGLDMAIINPSQKTEYNQIRKDLKNIIEDIIFDRDPNAVDKLIEFASEDIELRDKEKKVAPLIDKENENKNIEEILINDLIKGELKGIELHVEKALKEINDPVKIIEGPLLKGMKIVGDLFGEGKMFLPQVVKTARSMKRAVEILTPYIENSKKSLTEGKAGKILTATVKGDVHDIGKNIVSTVLACNNYEIIDLGIMVPGEIIVENALKFKPDLICLSGLITPSLAEMSETVKKLSEAGINVPVMVGGAATSLIHTALKIDPLYKGIVLHMGDASQNPIAAGALLNPEKKDSYIKEISEKYNRLRKEVAQKNKLVSYKEIIDKVALENRNNFSCEKPQAPIGVPIIIDINLKKIISLINWKMFFYAWKLQGKYLEEFPNISDFQKWLDNVDLNDRNKAEEALQLYQKAKDLLEETIKKGVFDGKGVVVFENARGDNKNIYTDKVVFPMLRQQKEDSDFLSCSDYIGKDKDNYIGFFAVTAGNYFHNLSKQYKQNGDNFNSLLAQTLADRIAEAMAEWLQNYISEKYWKISIRPAWGYPMLPDQTMILETQKFIPYEKIGISLTENGAMYPPASISGIYIAKPGSKYFMVGEIGEDQIMDYALRRNFSAGKIRSLLRQI